MTSLASWALVDVDRCKHCRRMEFIFTHSLANLRAYQVANLALAPFAVCLDCHKRAFRYISGHVSESEQADIEHLKASMPEISEDTFPELIKESPMCFTCGMPGSESQPLVEAHRQDDCTIIVQTHIDCRFWMGCCDTHYANGQEFASFRDESLRPPRTAFLHVLVFENRDKCLSCVNALLKENGYDLDDDYFICSWCQSYQHNDLREHDDGEEYCQNCIDRHRYYCEDCDTTYWEGDDHECDNDYNSGVIHDYSYKPRPYFFPPKERAPDTRLYFGIELEVESNRGDRLDNAEHVQSALGERAYLKYDGSLHNGFEIVTHPHTLDEFRKEFAFDKFASFRRAGLRSWDTDTCGLHIHVSRDAFGIPYDNRTDNYAEHISSRQTHELKFIKLVYDNEAQVCKLAGRKTGYAHFQDKGQLWNKVRNRGYDRHTAVNTENETTLEVRVFKGSLRPERVLGAIEFVHAGVEYTRNLKVNTKNGALSWVAFCGYVHTNQEQYSNLYALMMKSFRNEQDITEYQD